jgi:site-specific recombinase XerD
MAKEQRWPGGRIHIQKDGRPLYVIARTIRGERFHLSTRAHNLTAAMKQLERFEADPHGYSPAGVEGDEPLMLTNELILEHHAWSLNVRRNSRHHANDVAHRLSEWMEELGRRDLRKLTMRNDIKPALNRWETNRQHRIIALKSFYAWLRKEKHLLISAEDPTLDLPVPQAIPEKHQRKKVVEQSRVRAAWRQLKGGYADMLEVLAATGMHVSELERFIRQPEAHLVYGKRPLATLVTRHKSGDWTRIPLSDAAQVRAAERLKERGTVPRWFRLHLKEACQRAGVEVFTPGVLRHSVATHAVQKGAKPADVADMLGHRDKRTTEKFYIDAAIPRGQVPVMKMRKRHRAPRRRASRSVSAFWVPLVVGCGVTRRRGF